MKMWKKEAAEKEESPAFSFWKKDRAHQENTKEVSLKEGERERKERCERYSIRQDGSMMRTTFSLLRDAKDIYEGKALGTYI